jgi:transcriptional regulator with XRE-family HTH domain
VFDWRGDVRIEEVIGQRIREVREINDVTQEQLGRRLGELLGKEWSRQAVSTAEKGGRAFTAVELVALAHALGTTVPRLMTPPVNVRSVELPGGEQIGRQEVTRSTLPRASTEKAFADAEETLRVLAEHLLSVKKLSNDGLEVVGLAHEAMAQAAESIAIRIREHIAEEGEG